MTEKEIILSARMPVDVFEQLANLPPPEEQEQICRELFDKIRAILDSHSVVYDHNPEKSKPRVKTVEKIGEKVKTRNSIAPIRDIYGVRFIVGETDRYRINGMFQTQFPLTPETINGRPSVRDYADKKVLEDTKKNFNPHMSSVYSALHINVVFLREGEGICDIAEIQIMTEKELDLYEKTHEGYVSGGNHSFT